MLVEKVVKGRKFQVRIWLRDSGYWHLLLEDRKPTPTNYDKLSIEEQAFIRALNPRKIMFRQTEDGQTERVTVGDLPKMERKVHSTWPETDINHLGRIEEVDLELISQWLEKFGAGKLRRKVHRTINKMQKANSHLPRLAIS